MTNLTSPQVIQVIEEIKDSVERPHRCRWLENLQSEDGKRTKARRYRDGAVKIMALLRPELTYSDVVTYQRYRDRLRELPQAWTDERLAAAKKLWEYVLSLDEQLAHNRIISAPYGPYYTNYQYLPRSSAHRARTYRSPNQRVRFQDPDTVHHTQPVAGTRYQDLDTVPQVQPAVEARFQQPWATPPAATNPPPPRLGFHGTTWWPGNHYAPNWQATWRPAEGSPYGSAPHYSPYGSQGQYWHRNPYASVRG